MNGIFIGAIIGYVWFMIVLRKILVSDNSIKKLLKAFSIINTLTDDHISNVRLSREKEIYRQFQDLSEKQKQLDELKNKIRLFRENVEKMDFIKNPDMNDYNKNAKTEIDEKLSSEIEEILVKDKGELNEDEIMKINGFLKKIKKTK